MSQLRERLRLALLAVALVVIAGCHSETVDKKKFRAALNRYFSTRQDCLFDLEIKLPVQADAGLMQRTSEEKKRSGIGDRFVIRAPGGCIN